MFLPCFKVCTNVLQQGEGSTLYSDVDCSPMSLVSRVPLEFPVQSGFFIVKENPFTVDSFTFAFIGEPGPQAVSLTTGVIETVSLRLCLGTTR